MATIETAKRIPWWKEPTKALTLWMRLVGAVASGWLADRVGRKLPLMISILGYSKGRR